LLVLALGLALLAPVVPAQAAPEGPIGPRLPRPVADYRFQNSLASSVAGAPRLRNLNGIGINTFGTENVDGRNRTVLQFPVGNGLRLGNATSIVAPNRYTIAIKFRFDEVDGYRRVVALKPDSHPASDTGLYVNDSDLVWYNRAQADLDDIGADQWVTVVLTRSANGVTRGYVGPDRVFAFVDSYNRARIDPNRIIRFFRDDENDEESSGAVARIRLWDVVLTADQVARLSAV